MGRIEKGNETKSRICEAAIELCTHKGFENVSFQSLADRCKVSQSAVLYHFNNRVRLIEALVQYITKHNHETVDAQMQPLDRGFERLHKFIQGNWKWAEAHPAKAQLLILLNYSACANPELKKLHRKYQEIGFNRILSFVATGQREGDIITEPTPQEISSVVLALRNPTLLDPILKNNADPKGYQGIQEVWPTLLNQILTKQGKQVLKDLLEQE